MRFSCSEFLNIIILVVFLQPFLKFVEIGRIAVLQDGPQAGKIAAVVNVIDQNRVRTKYYFYEWPI